jgi:sphinganine-1-phosphate aldolase
MVHTKGGMADKFLNDVKEIVAELMKNPGNPVEGPLAVYGVAQTITDRKIVGDIIKLFLDSLYYTPK